MFASLGAKLAAVVFVLCASLLVMSVRVLDDSHEAMHAEMRQKFGLELIREIAEDGIAWMQALDDPAAADRLLARAARDNPHAALYLLDHNGNVRAATVTSNRARVSHIDVRPVERILAGERRFPLTGTNPVDPSNPEVFAVAAVPTEGPVKGYLYMVLPEERGAHGTTAISVGSAVHGAAIMLAAWAGIVFLAGLFVMKIVIRPLQRLTESAARFQGNDSALESVLNDLPRSRDEIGRLAQSFATMAKRIVQQMADLRKHDTGRRELFANISHDLRTPMASLLGYLETIAVKVNLPAEEKLRYCQIALQEAKHLSSLLDDLLELAKLDAPEAKLNAETFAVSEVIETACRTFELTAREQGVSLIKDVPSSQPLPLVLADPALIHRALENLIDNAVRHTPAGGTVTVSACVDGTGIAITVSDTGTGIPSAELPDIFDRYYRGGRERTHDHHGAGLGLPIVQRVLQLHGATLTVESRPNVLTSFRFVLPVADVECADMNSARLS